MDAQIIVALITVVGTPIAAASVKALMNNRSAAEAAKQKAKAVDLVGQTPVGIPAQAVAVSRGGTGAVPNGGAHQAAPPSTVQELKTPFPVEAYVRAFKALEPLHATHRSLLVAHYKAPDRTATFTELARVAELANYRAVNMQYGTLGGRVCELLNCQLSTKVEIFGTFTKPADGDWRLTMRPEVARALEALKWV